MTGDELRTEMRDGFKKVDDEFVNVRTEMRDGFKRVDDEFTNVRTEMRDGFKKVDDEFTNVRTEMRDGFKRVDDEFARVRTDIRVEGETTRRHFDIVAENLRESIRMIAEATAHNSSRLDNHETRLKRLERPRRR